MLYDFELEDYPHGDVVLLTLSACETALGGGNANEWEIEGVGAMAQKAGANSVLAHYGRWRTRAQGSSWKRCMSGAKYNG
ncbi:MAG: hypothetical protein AB2687_03520 [Candidatus Thiodiazotropha taylori]